VQLTQSHPDRRRYRSARVTDLELIHIALLRIRETARSMRLTKILQQTLPARNNLVGVTLMPNVPQQLIPPEIEHVVKRKRQLDNPQIARQMTAVPADRLDDELAYLSRQIA